MAKALLNAALMPFALLKSYQDASNFTKMLAVSEEMKTFPFGDVFEEYCRRSGVISDMSWLDVIDKYEAEVLSKR